MDRPFGDGCGDGVVWPSLPFHLDCGYCDVASRLTIVTELRLCGVGRWSCVKDHPLRVWLTIVKRRTLLIRTLLVGRLERRILWTCNINWIW